MPKLLKFIQALIQACQQIFLQEKKKMKEDREARTCQRRGIAASKNRQCQTPKKLCKFLKILPHVKVQKLWRSGHGCGASLTGTIKAVIYVQRQVCVSISVIVRSQGS